MNILKIFLIFSVYYFTFYHDCPVSDRACPISPTTSKILIQKLDFLKSSQLFYLWTKKKKILEVKLYVIHIWNQKFSIKTVSNTKKNENKFFVHVDSGLPYLYNIFWTNGYCCIPESINKIKNLIDSVSICRPQEENFYFGLM
jgi:hypothetical protein